MKKIIYKIIAIIVFISSQLFWRVNAALSLRPPIIKWLVWSSPKPSEIIMGIINKVYIVICFACLLFMIFTPIFFYVKYRLLPLEKKTKDTRKLFVWKIFKTIKILLLVIIILFLLINFSFSIYRKFFD